jgi:site-specific DNA-methyltransferase (adenine-specific)
MRYGSEGMNKVHLIDCMEFMKDVPDNYYELAIIDPPYRETNQPTKEMRDKINGRMKEFGKKPEKDLFDEIFRISKNQIIWGANNFIEYLYSTNCFIFWYKRNPMKNYSDGELAWTSFESVARCIPIDHYGSHTGDRGDIIHPTQKPVTLYKWLLKNYAKPRICKDCEGIGHVESYTTDCDVHICKTCNGSGLVSPKIFDSHVGSGSIRIACHDMGFDFEGCEIDEDYWNAQEERFNNYIKQGDLFSGKDLQEYTYKDLV